MDRSIFQDILCCTDVTQASACCGAFTLMSVPANCELLTSVAIPQRIPLLFDIHTQGNWQLAEQLFEQLEAEARAAEPVQAAPQTASPSSFNAYAVDWAASQPAQADTSSGWEHQQAATRSSSLAAAAVTPINISASINTGVPMSEVDDRRLSSGSFGDMPTHLAEQVGTLTHTCQLVVFFICVSGWLLA